MTKRTNIAIAVLLALALAGCAGAGPGGTGLADASAPPAKAKAKPKPAKTPARKAGKVTIAAPSQAEPLDAPTPEPNVARGHIVAASSPDEALGAAEARSLIAGNSIYVGGGNQRFAAYHAAGGTLKGKSWAGAQADTGAGQWKIGADGQYCRKWNNGWAGGEWGCFKLYRQGSAVMMERVSGAGANGKVTLVTGNAYGL